jgi:hypothetical protein
MHFFYFANYFKIGEASGVYGHALGFVARAHYGKNGSIWVVAANVGNNTTVDWVVGGVGDIGDVVVAELEVFGV